ncbi:hypothetical protein IWW50_002542 [Coemansia erecta]|nr:hypothetical protein GGF43_003848 [Coemansia sp. RSA 2618]KAJ2826089.1 hypothetical protein IWW50_002542 [Coemansia erecta]
MSDYDAKYYDSSSSYYEVGMGTIPANTTMDEVAILLKPKLKELGRPSGDIVFSYYKLDLSEIDQTTTMDEVEKLVKPMLKKLGESCEAIVFVLGDVKNLSVGSYDAMVMTDSFALEYWHKSGLDLNIMSKSKDDAKKLKNEWNTVLKYGDSVKVGQFIKLLKP